MDKAIDFVIEFRVAIDFKNQEFELQELKRSYQENPRESEAVYAVLNTYFPTLNLIASTDHVQLPGNKIKAVHVREFGSNVGAQMS